MSGKDIQNSVAETDGANSKIDLSEISGITGVSDMEYFSIQSNYRFDALIRAIDFFSQKFNMETLLDYAAEFINEILALGDSVLFVLSEDEKDFTVSKSRIYKSSLTKISSTVALQNAARLSGTVLTKNFSSLFCKEFVEEYKPSIMIPLIHSNKLIGFIASSGKAVGEFDDDDFNMANALMHLFNGAFERHFLLDEVDKKMKALDSTMFELCTVHKTSRVLFSEIELDKVLSTGAEIFSEVSGSTVTAFALKDAETGNLVVRSYKDVKAPKPCPENFFFEMIDATFDYVGKYIFNVEDELEELKKFFKTPEKLKELKAERIILIIKDSVMGFVTLGESNSPRGFSDEMMELVGSLAISCFIAINNAMLFSEMTSQKNDIEQRYNNLKKLVGNK